jgi:hypothetical protein
MKKQFDTRRRVILLIAMLLLSCSVVFGQETPEAQPAETTREEAINERTAKPAAFGMYIGLGPAIVGTDLRVGKVYGYLSGSLLLPMVYDHLKIDASLGIGPAFRFFSDNWTFHVYGTAHLDLEGINTVDIILAVGAGLGWRFVHPKGFTLGFRLPFLGYAIPIRQPSGFFDLSHNALRVAYYYFTFAKSTPVFSIGYTF